MFSKLGRTQSRLRTRIERPFGLSGVVPFGKKRFPWRIVTPFLAPLSQRTSVSNRRKGNSINSSLGAKPHVARADIEDIQSGLKAPKKVFVDELNKYAPEGAKGSPILDQVLEVSERGRSLAIVLYGAQQFLSAVHDRVTGNCSTTLLGRTNASEMAERSYRFLNRDIKAAATRLEKGQLILNHAVFREPVKIKFPAITCDRRRLGECSAMILWKRAPQSAPPDRAISAVSCDLAIILDCEAYPALI